MKNRKATGLHKVAAEYISMGVTQFVMLSTKIWMQFGTNPRSDRRPVIEKS